MSVSLEHLQQFRQTGIPKIIAAFRLYQIWAGKARDSLLLLYSCQPSSHIRLMLFMEVSKEVTWFDRLRLQPWEIVRWITEDCIG